MRADRDLDPGTDRNLLEQARDQSRPREARRAEAELLGRYREHVYVWCLRYVHDHERALELAQDVLLKAHQRLDSYRGPAPFHCWLFAVTRNRCFDELRRPPLLREDPLELADRVPDDRTPDRLLEERLDEEALLLLIRETLDPLEQQALRLRCFERMPVDAITAVLGVTERSGARAVLQRARRKLRAALRRREEEVD
ncbi:MAG: sigma-70 family RNA polymerase sigma factor [Candidatus Krumholzibacteriia bacterium]